MRCASNFLIVATGLVILIFLNRCVHAGYPGRPCRTERDRCFMPSREAPPDLPQSIRSSRAEILQVEAIPAAWVGCGLQNGVRIYFKVLVLSWPCRGAIAP